MSTSEVINSRWEAMRFGNVNGEDIFVYPGFALMRSDAKDFALIDLQDFNLDFSYLPFHEEERVPPDSDVIGHTWKKANKDGSRDRRFADNYQIPIMRYGEAKITSKHGLQEAYMFSNADAGAFFAASFQTYQRLLVNRSSRGSSAEDRRMPAREVSAELDVRPASASWPTLPHRPRPFALAFDVLALSLLGIAGSGLFAF